MVLDLALTNLPLLLILVGAGLIIAEAFAPGAHFFVVGVALFAAGLVGYLGAFVLPGTVNLVLMSLIVIVASLATLWVYRELDVMGGSGKAKTSDSDSLRGSTGRVTERVTPTEGEIKLADGGFNPYYKARSMDGEIPEGEEVIVVDPGGGNVVTVESVSKIRDDIDRELEADRERTAEREPN
jgi:membrane protein implicated in regulation of membrane protease activity